MIAVIIGSVVAYVAVGLGFAGFVHERTADEGAALPAGIFWPLVVTVWAVAKIGVRFGEPIIRLGRRLATPKSQLPEARALPSKQGPAGARPGKAP